MKKRRLPLSFFVEFLQSEKNSVAACGGTITLMIGGSCACTMILVSGTKCENNEKKKIIVASP